MKITPLKKDVTGIAEAIIDSLVNHLPGELSMEEKDRFYTTLKGAYDDISDEEWQKLADTMILNLLDEAWVA